MECVGGGAKGLFGWAAGGSGSSTWGGALKSTAHPPHAGSFFKRRREGGGGVGRHRVWAYATSANIPGRELNDVPYGHFGRVSLFAQKLCHLEAREGGND